MRYRSWSFALQCALLAAASGCGRPLWNARSLPACDIGSSTPELDRERTYLAALLALSERHYVILHASAPQQIEATYPSEYQAPRNQTRWLLTVQPDASLVIDTPPPWRQTQRNTEGRYLKLVQSIDELRCRDPNWLRWEAQNRGLVPIGAYAAEPGAPEGSSGGEQEAHQKLQLELRTTDERLAALMRERADLKLGRTVAWGASGLVLHGAGISLLAQGAVHYAQGCDDRSELPLADYEGYGLGGTFVDCSARRTGRILMNTGAGLTLAGVVVLSLALPRFFRRLAQVRELNREIKRLRRAKLSVGAGPSAWGATLSVPL